MSQLNLALVLIGSLTLLSSLLVGVVRARVYVLSEAMLATLLGIVAGPAVLDLLRIESWGGDPLAILEQAARLTLAVAVMSAALRLPRGYLREHAASLAVIVGLGMLGMWILSGLLVWGLLGLPFWVAALVGAVVTPTDPVLAGSIVNGEMAEKNITSRVRHLLTAESAANDGAALAFVLLTVFMLTMTGGAALGKWALDVVLWDIGGGIGIGLLLGAGAGWIERWSERKDLIDDAPMLAVTVALAFTTLGLAKLVGSDGILAVFAAGIAFNNTADVSDEHREQQTQEAVNRLFTFPIFVLFGLVVPWADYAEMGWGRLLALAGLLLLLRRLPVVFALAPLLSPLQRRADTSFLGWFGPIGVAAIFYATLAVHQTHHHEVWVVASFVVLASVAAHGATSTPFTRWYGRAIGRTSA